MGITGLLKQLAPLMTDGHLQEMKGSTVAIDGYVWLHKSCYSCALELCLNMPTEQYVKYFLRRVRMFRHFEVCPLIVFDGAKLQSKSTTDEKRRKLREQNLREGKALWKQAQALKKGGERKRLVDAAREKFQRASHVSKAMVDKVCRALKKEKVEVLVAPFEADAQLIYLHKINKCQGIVTEDSDLVVFALAQEMERCTLIYKFEENGSCQFLRVRSPREMYETYTRILNRLEDDGSSNEPCEGGDPPVKFLLNLRGFDIRMFVQTCILSGCDYTEKLAGIGLRTAQDLVLQYRSIDAERRVSRILRFQKLSKKREIPDQYMESFLKAEAQFFYQVVYDPRTSQLVNLRSFEDKTGKATICPRFEFPCKAFLGSFPKSFTKDELEVRAKGEKRWTDLREKDDKENAYTINMPSKANTTKRGIQQYFKPSKGKQRAHNTKRRRITARTERKKGTLFSFFTKQSRTNVIEISP